MDVKICKKCGNVKELLKSNTLICRNCKNSNSRRYHALNKINGKIRIRKQLIYPLNTLKFCKQCKIDKPISLFNKKIDGKYGVRTSCKECESIFRLEVYKNPILLEKRRGYNKKAKLKSKNCPLSILKKV